MPESHITLCNRVEDVIKFEERWIIRFRRPQIAIYVETATTYPLRYNKEQCSHIAYA